MSLPFHSLDAAVAPSPASTNLGQMPEWRLEDLYEGVLYGSAPRPAAGTQRAAHTA